MGELFTMLGINKLSIVLAGAIGGTVSLRHYAELTIKKRILIIIGSVALANYLTPPAVAYFGPEAIHFELGIAAGIGMFGLSIASSMTDVIQDTEYWKKFMRGIFTRRDD